MITQLILVIFSLVVFLSYNIVALKFFGIPKSLSETFYLWDSKIRNLGYCFTGMMFTMAMSLLPAWLDLGEVVSTWSTYLQPLAFFTCAAIAFVGAAPAFRSCKLESTVHNVAAKVAAACAVIWCFTVCWQIAYVPAIVAGLVAVVGLLTKTWKRASIYWLEMMAFGATFVTVIVELLMHL